jgi:hypothetical protein
LLSLDFDSLFLKVDLEEVLSRFPFSFSPFVQAWLEEALKELCHASEGCSSVEEVKLLVVFFILI